MAAIKYLAQCPCPRCLVKKEQIDAIGTKVDSIRRSQIREDDESRREQVERARGWIFERGYSVVSAAVERLLSTSLIPTRVRHLLFYCDH